MLSLLPYKLFDQTVFVYNSCYLCIIVWSANSWDKWQTFAKTGGKDLICVDVTLQGPALRS